MSLSNFLNESSEGEKEISLLSSAIECLSWYYYWPARLRESETTLIEAKEILTKSLIDDSANAQLLGAIAKISYWLVELSIQLAKYATLEDEINYLSNMIKQLEEMGEDVRPERARLLAGRASLEAEYLANREKATQCAIQSLDLFRDIDDRFSIVVQTTVLGQYAEAAGDYAQAEIFSKEAWDLAKELDHPYQSVWPLLTLSP